MTPLRELVNVFEVEAEAKRKLDPTAFAEIAHNAGDRAAFDHITFRPRLMVDTTKLDLTVELFGSRHFAPILIGPVANHSRFHADAEAATVRGAAAAKAAMVVAGRSGLPLDKILAGNQNNTLWYQIHAEGSVEEARSRAQRAIQLGCKALCLTIGAGAWSWPDMDRFRLDFTVPLVLKGIMSAGDASKAIAHGAGGLIVSSYGVPSAASSMTVLPLIVDAVSGKVPILIDGGFRRGTDILKALALGARAVLLGRPPLWGLSAYGAEGVQYVVEMLQTELARAMAMCGTATVGQVTRDHVRLHR